MRRSLAATLWLLACDSPDPSSSDSSTGITTANPSTTGAGEDSGSESGDDESTGGEDSGSTGEAESTSTTGPGTSSTSSTSSTTDANTSSTTGEVSTGTSTSTSTGSSTTGCQYPDYCPTTDPGTSSTTGAEGTGSESTTGDVEPQPWVYDDNGVKVGIYAGSPGAYVEAGYNEMRTADGWLFRLDTGTGIVRGLVPGNAAEITYTGQGSCIGDAWAVRAESFWALEQDCPNVDSPYRGNEVIERLWGNDVFDFWVPVENLGPGFIRGSWIEPYSGEEFTGQGVSCYGGGDVMCRVGVTKYEGLLPTYSAPFSLVWE